MLAIGVILQDSAPLASQPGALGTLNTLGLAVFLVGIGVLLLLSAHYYRRRDIVGRKARMKRGYGVFGTDADLATQLPFMTRDELKEMVLKERSAREQADVPGEPVEPAPLMSVSAPPHEPDTEKPTQLAREPIEAEKGAESPEQTATLPGKTTAETELLAHLAMPSEDEEEESKEPPKPPLHDRVERSLLSNESWEEFRRKSRKI